MRWKRLKHRVEWVTIGITLMVWAKSFWTDHLPDLATQIGSQRVEITPGGYFLMAVVLTSILVGHFVTYRLPAILERRRVNSPEERLHEMLPSLEQAFVDTENETIDEALMEEIGIRTRELGIGINATGAGRRLNLSQDLPHLIACARTRNIKAARNFRYSFGASIRVKPDQDEGCKYIFRPSHEDDK